MKTNVTIRNAVLELAKARCNAIITDVPTLENIRETGIAMAVVKTHSQCITRLRLKWLNSK